MKRYTLHLIAVGLVTAWALLATTYDGGDRRSGLSLLGWLQLLFILPGFSVTSSWVLVVAIGWLTFTACGVGLAHLIVSVASAVRPAAAGSELKTRSRA